VYGTLFLGRQALAKAHSIVDGNGENPHIVPGPVTDYLRRFLPLGWYHLVGYGVFRQAALRRVESSSSIDDGTDSGQDNSVVYTATATNTSSTLTFTAAQATFLQGITSTGTTVTVTGAGITPPVVILSINDGTGVVTVATDTGGAISTLTTSAYTFSWTENQ
jgi:hypothetical protein